MKTYQTRAFSDIDFDQPVTQRLTKAALGLAAKSGELAHLVKTLTIDKKTIDRAKALEILGDALWYLTLAAKSVGGSLDEVAEANLKRVIKLGRAAP